MKGLANMKELRFLHVNMVHVTEDEVSNCNFDEDSLHLPNALRFLSWDFYPFSSLPKTFQAKDLVGLEMKDKAYSKLRFLKFTFSKFRTLDLSMAPNLETLILEDCHDLVEVHFQVTPNLKQLRIFDCDRLEKLHIPAGCPNLENLLLYYCTDMVELQITAGCPKLVTLGLLKIEKLRTLDLGLTPNLERVDLIHCYDLEEFNVQCLKKLLHLCIRDCGRFEDFDFDKKLDSPEVVTLSELHLIANDTGICDPGNTWPEFKFSCYYKEDPASSFGNLERLFSLGFSVRVNFDSFSDIICGLQCLRKLTLEGGIPEAPKNLDQLDCLEELSLRSTDIKTLPDSIYEMKRLKCLELTCCSQVEIPEEIGRLECLKELNILGSGIIHLPHSLYGLRGLRIIGDRWLFESCGLTPKRRRMSDEDSDFDDEMVCDI